MRLARLPALVLAPVVLLLGGCGGSDEPPEPPSGPLAAALGSVGGGGANGSLGFGWAEPQLAAALGPAAPRLIGDALGPNADSVIEAAPAFQRRFGFDPLAAQRLVSVGGSYAFGLRLEGVDASSLQRALVADGGQTREAAGTELVDIGGYASVPDALLDLGVNGLGARDAFNAEKTVLAISDTARDALLGRGSRLIDEPIYAAAVDCLGDALVARMVPAKLLLSTELGFSAVAMGVGRGEEVLCVLGGTAERADEVTAALEGTLARGARDPRTGEPIAAAVASAEVRAKSYDGVEVVRALITPAPEAEPGFLFGAASRGSLVGLINGEGR